MKNTIKKLDELASALEGNGLQKYASRIDVVSNSIEQVSSTKQKDNGPDTDGGDE